MLTNAVFQGGGVKGIALVGALSKLEESGIRFRAVGGSSAGAIVASLYAAGYTAEDMKGILEQTDFSQLLDSSLIGLMGFVKHKGWNRGNKLYEWIYLQLEKKGVRTFGDLNDIDLKIVSSDLTNREILIFDKISNPTMKVAEAVRMSIGIPLFFDPYRFGERLVVDGGLLSNYPLWIFEDSENTVGFKLVSKTAEVPKAPNSFLGYITSLVNTMMDAHDKEDERQSGHKNTIHIDNGGIGATKFDLSTLEKNLLFQNGYHAASQFLNEHVEVLSNLKDRYIRIDSPFSEPLTVQVPDTVPQEELVRVSISGLFRIYVDGKYLLLPGNRIRQYQPVGGVFKRLEKSSSRLKELGVVDDDKFPIDGTSRDDLRVRVPLAALPKFLEWYRTESGREVTPYREFREELVESNLVSADLFKYIFYERLRTHVRGVAWSEYFECYEVLIAEIYELNPTSDQLNAFRDMQNGPDDRYLWCSEAQIRSKGYDVGTKTDIARISETAGWTL